MERLCRIHPGDERGNLTGIMVSKGNHPQMAELFFWLVKYYFIYPEQSKSEFSRRKISKHQSGWKLWQLWLRIDHFPYNISIAIWRNTARKAGTPFPVAHSPAKQGWKSHWSHAEGGSLQNQAMWIAWISWMVAEVSDMAKKNDLWTWTDLIYDMWLAEKILV